MSNNLKLLNYEKDLDFCYYSNDVCNDCFFVIPKESSAKITLYPFEPGTGRHKVVKIKKNISTNTIISATNLGCLTEAQIGALPPDPYYRSGHKRI